MTEELALEVFGILTEHEIKTLGDQKKLCREIAEWATEKDSSERNRLSNWLCHISRFSRGKAKEWATAALNNDDAHATAQ